MTPNRAKELLPVIQAFAEGKAIQWKYHELEEWHTLIDITCNFEKYDQDFRIKPTPTFRPWKPEEVPIGALLRTKHKPEYIVVILGATQEKVILSNRSPSHSEYLFDLTSYHGGNNGDCVQYSKDNGKTWYHCGVEE